MPKPLKPSLDSEKFSREIRLLVEEWTGIIVSASLTYEIQQMIEERDRILDKSKSGKIGGTEE